MWSLVSIKQQSPRRPCDILMANVGPEVAKTAKTAKTAKCVKKCAKLKMTNTAFSGVSQQSYCQGVCQSVLCVPEGFASQPRPIQAQRPCLAFPSLPQHSPADSCQFRAQEPCPAAQRSRESAYHSGSFPEKLQGPRVLTVPRDVPRWSPGHVLLQPIGTVPRTENHVFLHLGKTLKLNIYFIYFNKTLTFLTCFYIYVTGSQPYWISTSCQPCLFTNCISCQPYWFYNFTQLWQFNCEVKLKVDLWLDYSYFVYGPIYTFSHRLQW